MPKHSLLTSTWKIQLLSLWSRPQGLNAPEERVSCTFSSFSRHYFSNMLHLMSIFEEVFWVGSASEPPFLFRFCSGLLSSYQYVWACSFCVDGMNCRLVFCFCIWTCKPLTAEKVQCQRVGYWNSWLSKPGEAGDPVSRKCIHLFPCTLDEYAGVCSTALHLTAASVQEFSRSLHFTMEFLCKLDFLRGKKWWMPIRREEKGGRYDYPRLIGPRDCVAVAPFL